jgi:hypothetical protein
MQKWLAAVLVPLVGSALLIAGVIFLGRAARSQLTSREHRAQAFADIDVVPPRSQSRADFLSEVQFLAGLPDRLALRDPEVLMDAFARHPWVEAVERVDLDAAPIRVSLTYRTPVLAVPRRGPDGPLRAVDGRGILLPLAALVAGLPILDGDVPPPAGGAGLPWGDPDVHAATAVAALLLSHQETLRIERIRVRRGEVWLQARTGTIRWGRPPGANPAARAASDRKVAQLLKQLEQPSPAAAIDLEL